MQVINELPKIEIRRKLNCSQHGYPSLKMWETQMTIKEIEVINFSNEPCDPKGPQPAFLQLDAQYKMSTIQSITDISHGSRYGPK